MLSAGQVTVEGRRFGLLLKKYYHHTIYRKIEAMV